MLDALAKVTPQDDDGNVNVFIETPAGSEHKFDLDHEVGLFRWSLSLPDGLTFPYSFGFVPNTLSPDGDPLDILLMLNGEVPAGTIVTSRLLGVLKVEQDEGGKMVRNDRVIATATLSRTFGHLTALDQARPGLSWDLGLFFESYNRMIGRDFRVLGDGGPEDAQAELDEAIDRARK